MKLAILSDTHGLLRPEVMERLKDAGAILHGGDINRQSILDQLEEYAPLYVVRGNNDKEWAEQLPHDRTVTLEGVTFFLVHNRKEVPAELSGVDVVVFGHSHRYVQEERDGVLWLNPGSCGPRRFHQEITMMLAEVSNGQIFVEKVAIPHGTADHGGAGTRRRGRDGLQDRTPSHRRRPRGVIWVPSGAGILISPRPDGLQGGGGGVRPGGLP